LVDVIIVDEQFRKPIGRPKLTIQIDAATADSTGRRNTGFILHYQELVEDFCGCLPAKRLPWARVQCVSHGIKFAY
jgi:hypothetical protein